MSDIQGLSLLWQKRSALVAATLHGLEGARRLPTGIWRGLDDIDPTSYRRLDAWSSDGPRLTEFLQQALLASRYLVPIRPEWFTLGVGFDRQEENGRLASAFGLSSTRSMFTGMISCVLSRELEQVRFTPKRRGRGGDFDAFPESWQPGHEEIDLAWSDPPQVWLEAATLCFARCV